jgi:hypothetical protein
MARLNIYYPTLPGLYPRLREIWEINDCCSQIEVMIRKVSWGSFTMNSKLLYTRMWRFLVLDETDPGTK